MADYSSLSIWQRVEGSLWNAATGTLTQAQKDALVQQEVQGRVMASGGTLSAADVTDSANQDVTAVLMQDKADPSQASVFNNAGLDALFQKAGWVLGILALILVLWVFLKVLHYSRGGD